MSYVILWQSRKLKKILNLCRRTLAWRESDDYEEKPASGIEMDLIKKLWHALTSSKFIKKAWPTPIYLTSLLSVLFMLFLLSWLLETILQSTEMISDADLLGWIHGDTDKNMAGRTCRRFSQAQRLQGRYFRVCWVHAWWMGLGGRQKCLGILWLYVRRHWDGHPC